MLFFRQNRAWRVLRLDLTMLRCRGLIAVPKKSRHLMLNALMHVAELSIGCRLITFGVEIPL